MGPLFTISVIAPGLFTGRKEKEILFKLALKKREKKKKKRKSLLSQAISQHIYRLRTLAGRVYRPSVPW